MWNNNFYQQPGRGGYPWQQAQQRQAVINGQRGPLGVPGVNDSYEANPMFRPGARGFNAAYNQLQQQGANDWFGQSRFNSVQYTSAKQPTYWDAFGYAAGQVQFYGRGQNQLSLQDVQQAFRSSQADAQNVLCALDTDNSGGLSEQELGVFTLLSDSPGPILWNAVQANKNNPNYPNRLPLLQLEAELRQSLPFDASGNPINRPADGRLDPADRELLNRAMALTPDLVRTIVQELRRSLNLDTAYNHYNQANQRWQGTFQAPPAPLPPPISSPAINPWQLFNGLPSTMPQSAQTQLVLLLLILSSQNGSTALDGLSYQGNSGLPAFNPLFNYPYAGQHLNGLNFNGLNYAGLNYSG